MSGCVWAADNQSFVLGTLDRKHGLSTFNVNDEAIREWGRKHRVQDLCGSPDGRWLVAVDDLSVLHIYNGVTRELDFNMEFESRPTSVSISSDSRYLLVNTKAGQVRLIDLPRRNPVHSFIGHSGGDYLIRSAFGGANESFIVSGSEDGHPCIWQKHTGNLVERLPKHDARCNAVEWNPADPFMLVSASDDGQVKM